MLDTSTRTPDRSDQRSKGLGELNREPRTGKVLSRSPALRRVVRLVLTAAATLALLFFVSPGFRSDLTDFVTFVGSIDAASIRVWILSFGTLSPLVYFLIVVGQVILNPIPAGPVTLAGALIFGVWEGLALSMAGSGIGSVLVFTAVRRWGEPLLLRVVDEKTYANYAGKLGRGGWWFFLLMLLPLMPDDAVCALAGLSAMSLRRYVVFMVVGRLPGATLTSLLASEAIPSSTAGWITAGLFLAVLLALALIYRSRLERWILWRTGDGSERGSDRWDG